MALEAVVERVEETYSPETLGAFFRALKGDLRDAELTTLEARWLVGTYWSWQEVRKRAANQYRDLGKAGKPNRHLYVIQTVGYGLEEALKMVLEEWVQQSVVGRWSLAQHGIGPVIAAGLMAYIDMEKCPTVGHIYSFAGWVPGLTWQPGEKRPYNPRMRTLLWKIGDSFVKQSGKKQCYYGHLYVQAKERIQEKDRQGGYADLAQETLAKFPHHKQRDYYKKGHLPPGRIDLMARRIAVKVFLSHWHAVAHWVAFKKLAPRPFAIEHLGHTDVIPIRYAGLVPGMIQAYKKAGRGSEVREEE